jgi:hypothetical protein
MRFYSGYQYFNEYWGFSEMNWEQKVIGLGKKWGSRRIDLPLGNFCLKPRLGSSGASKNGTNLREDRADLARDVRHDSASGYGDETGHQRVFDEVLTFGIAAKGKDKAVDFIHFV